MPTTTTTTTIDELLRRVRTANNLRENEIPRPASPTRPNGGLAVTGDMPDIQDFTWASSQPDTFSVNSGGVHTHTFEASNRPSNRPFMNINTSNLRNPFGEDFNERVHLGADEDLDEDFDEDLDEDIDSDNERRSSPRFNRRTQNIENQDNMSTIGEYFGRNMDPSNVVKHSLVEGTSRVGIEIEVEGFTANVPRMRYWVAKHDGSLRDNGMEFVFSSPLGGADIKSAVDEIDTILFNNRVSLNLRCSTHVHVDVRDLTVSQLKRLILAYTFFETFLFRQSGEYRLKSNFCTPLSFAEGLAVTLANVWNTDDPHYFLSYLTDSWDKYCGINILPMRSFGSVEFRMSEAKTRKGQLLRLVNRFLVLKNIAISSELEDEDFINYLTSLDIREVFRKGLTKTSDIREEDLEIGYYIANDIVNRELIKSEKLV